jgi:hypothetical protein
MNAFHGPLPAAPVIPETAPFSLEQRAWLNGFFAGLLSLDSQPGTALRAQEGAAFAAMLGTQSEALGIEDDGAPWLDQTLPLGERMKLAKSRALPRRMMKVIAQQDCGQCGYNCEDYASAIATHAEEQNLCVPGAKETGRTLKNLIDEMGGGASDPDEAKGKAEATAIGKARDVDTRPGRSRNMPPEAVFVGCKRLNREGSGKATYHVDFDISEAGLDYELGDSFGIFPVNDDRLVDRMIEAIDAPHDFPIADKTLHQVWSRESESKVYVQDKMREKRPTRGHGSAKAPFLCLRRCQAHGGRCRGGARSCLRGAWKKGCGRCPRVPEGTPRKTPVSDGGLLMNAHAAGLSVRTSCPYCGVGCGVVATADVAGGAAIAGDKSHPANFGRLCSKGSTLDETLALETRLLHPRVDGVRATWDGGPRSHHSRI